MEIIISLLCVLVGIDIVVRTIAYKKFISNMPKKIDFFEVAPNSNDPVKVQTPRGLTVKCWGVGKESAIVGGDFKGDRENQYIKLEDFRRDYIMPDSLERLVDEILIEKNTAHSLEEALQELNSH